MRRKITGEDVSDSSSFRTARERAQGYAGDPGKLNALLDRALRKALARKRRLAEVWESLQASLRLLRAYATGSYRDIPWSSLVSIIAAVVYFVMPADLIPDIFFSVGLLDDAALLGWVLASVKTDVDAFLRWESEQQTPPADSEAEDPRARN